MRIYTLIEREARNKEAAEKCNLTNEIKEKRVRAANQDALIHLIHRLPQSKITSHLFSMTRLYGYKVCSTKTSQMMISDITACFSWPCPDLKFQLKLCEKFWTLVRLGASFTFDHRPQIWTLVLYLAWILKVGLIGSRILTLEFD